MPGPRAGTFDIDAFAGLGMNGGAAFLEPAEEGGQGNAKCPG